MLSRNLADLETSKTTSAAPVVHPFCAFVWVILLISLSFVLVHVNPLPALCIRADGYHLIGFGEKKKYK
jgi:hypothetical protein